MSKLYTENDMRRAFIAGNSLLKNDTIDVIRAFYDLLNYTAPIKLPTDEEIKEEAKKEILYALEAKGFHDGAKWMRDKIKGGGDE